jgi:hypothetical protein
VNLADMEVDPQKIDTTKLTEEEIQLVGKIMAVYGNVFLGMAMNNGIGALLQAAIGVTLRVIKANDSGLKVSNLADLAQLTIPGVK